MSPECRQCREYISHYLDGETTPAEEQFIRQHTPTCLDCREALRSYQNIRAQFRASTPPIPPTALRQALLAGVRNGGRGAVRVRTGSRLGGTLFGRSISLGMGLVTAVIVFVMAVAVLVTSLVVPKNDFELEPIASSQLPSGNSTIILHFTKPVDETEVRQHLNANPPVSIHVIGDGTEVELKPLQELTSNETVSITIEGLRDKNNEPLKNNQVQLQYKVANPTPTNTPPSPSATNTPKPPAPTVTPKPNPSNTPVPSNTTERVTPTVLVVVTTLPPTVTPKPNPTTTLPVTPTKGVTKTPEPTKATPTVGVSPTVTTTTVGVSPTVTATTTVGVSPTVTTTVGVSPTITATTTVELSPTITTPTVGVSTNPAMTGTKSITPEPTTPTIPVTTTSVLSTSVAVTSTVPTTLTTPVPTTSKPPINP